MSGSARTPRTRARRAAGTARASGTPSTTSRPWMTQWVSAPVAPPPGGSQSWSVSARRSASKRSGLQRAVAGGHGVREPGEVATGRLQLGQEGRSRVAHRHGHVGHDLASAPALAQGRRVPHGGRGSPRAARPGRGTRRRCRRVRSAAEASSAEGPVPGPVMPAPRRGRPQSRAIRGKAVERRRETGLRVGNAQRRGHVGLVDAHLGPLRPELDERRRHPHTRPWLGPRQQLGRPHLVVDGPRRVLAPVGVVHHHGLEHAAGTGVDRDAPEGRADPGGAPEMCQVLGLDHAAEDQFSWRLDDASEVQLVPLAHVDAPLRRRGAFCVCPRVAGPRPGGVAPRSARRCASSLSKRSSQTRRCVLIQSSVPSSAATSR